MKRGISLCCAALGLSTSWIAIGVPHAWAQASPTPAPTAGQQQSESLKGKTNEELVNLLVGGKSTRKLEEEERRANEVKTHLPERFWEMPPKDAALALVRDNCNLKLKPQLNISVRGQDRHPPEKGRVQLRLEFGRYNIPWETLLDLSSDRTRSTLSFSSVELRGPVKRAVVEQALRRTTRCDLPGEEARRLYETIWWLGQIQFNRPKQETTDKVVITERIVASHSMRGKLSVEPGGPRKEEITLCHTSLSECYYETFDGDLYASFIHFLLQETFKRQGVDSDQTSVVLGKETFSSSDEKFALTTKPPPANDPSAAKWIDRMLRILKTDSFVLWDLAPSEEPLRYSDPRIDHALFGFLHGGLLPQALDRKTDERGFNNAADAARALARRERAEAFPIIMQLLEVRNDEVSNAKNDLLEAATLLASSKREYRQQLVEYLTGQLRGLENTRHFTSLLFDSVWRGDLRELTPLLEKMAAASPDEIEDDLGWSTPPRRVVGKFHGPRRILLAWRESEPLTKLKLDAIIEASAGYFGKPAELLGQQFAALSEDEKRAFEEFVRWLEEYKPSEVQTSWDPASVAEIVKGNR